MGCLDGLCHGSDPCGNGGIQDHHLRVPLGAAKGLTDNLRAQAAAPHAKEHDVAVAGTSHLLGEGLQGGDLTPHQVGDAEPPEAVGDLLGAWLP